MLAIQTLRGVPETPGLCGSEFIREGCIPDDKKSSDVMDSSRINSLLQESSYASQTAVRNFRLHLQEIRFQPNTVTVWRLIAINSPAGDQSMAAVWP